MSRARRVPLSLLAVAAVAALVLGVWLGGHPGLLPGPVRDVFVAEGARTLDTALDTIAHDYYRPVGRGVLVDASLEGAVAKLHDRFSRYLTPSDYRRFQQSSQGRFSGVGMEVSETARGLRVARVFRGAPAARAGIRRGDEIVAVNGRSIAGKSSRVTTSLIRGRPGTYVALTVVSDGRRRAVRLKRAEVAAPVVESSLRTVDGRRIGVVALASFTEGAHGELRGAIDGLRRRGAQAMVLDLRDNGGGLLGEAVQVASVFVPEGTIVSTRGRARARHVYTATGSAIPRRVPVVVLVNGGTASASEIVAAAVQDRHRGIVVGAHTYGKGVFQEVRELPNGGALDLTVGEYYTPAGRNLGGGGIRRGAGVRPDVEAADDSRTPPDEALDAALRAAAREL